MSESQIHPILTSLVTSYPWIKFDAEQLEFQCKCGVNLAFDKSLIKKMTEIKADPIIAHVCEKARPWLEEHSECSGSALAE
jgi:hypothetical protein